MRKLIYLIPITMVTAFVIAGIKHDTNRQLPPSQDDYIIETMVAQTEAPTELETATIEYLTPSYDFSFIVKETEAPAEVPTTEIPTTEAPTTAPVYDIPLDAEMQNSIRSIAEEYQISFELILAIIKTESNFHADSIGDNGNAIGLMQIQPKWWSELAGQMGLDIYNPIDNVRLGKHIFASHLEACGGDLNRALKKYNSGNPNCESDVYVNTVLRHLEEINGK